MITALVALLGGAGVLLGLVGYLRARFRRIPSGARRRGVRRAAAFTGASGLALLLPDALTGLSTDLGADLYRLAVLGWLGVVATVMALTSHVVVDPVRASLARMSRRRRRVRADFPSSWDALVEHDRSLARRLLAYDHDLELAVNAPVMSDYTNEHTAAAVHAMLRCDAVRTPVPPRGTHDVTATEYGRAVIAFEQALAAAEANAQRLSASTFSDDERRSLDEAARTLAFMREHATTPAEREAAYAQVRTLLDAPRHRASAPAGVREHPFLTVHERAR